MTPPSKLSRRTVFVGAGTVGAIVATASLLPSVKDGSLPSASLPKAPEKGGGYSLSNHVKQYYQTTRT